MSDAALALLQRRFDETQRLAGIGSWDLELDGHAPETSPVWWSAEVYRQLGYDPAAGHPAPERYLARIPEPSRQQVVEALRIALESGVLDLVHPLDVPGSPRRFVHVLGHVVRDAGDGRALRLVGTMHDITDRLAIDQALRQSHDTLEQRVADRTAELAATVREFEEFSYSISHDLRAPLRYIDGFARILVDDHAAALSPEARGHLERIVRSAGQMAGLIDGLLEFTRTGRQAYLESAIDMDKLVDGVLEQLRGLTSGREIAWDRQPLAPTRGDAALLRQVWIHLLDNALKFTRGLPAASIGIASEFEGGETWYTVTDNGAGFDPKYADRLFTLFQRLHPSDEFPGSGVGLATARRAVQRHGGRIEATSEPGRGTRVRFCLRCGL